MPGNFEICPQSFPAAVRLGKAKEGAFVEQPGPVRAYHNNRTSLQAVACRSLDMVWFLKSTPKRSVV